ncbi:MAG TPA: hypothetical protein VHB69_00955 [Mycobacteriales bacterium]|nr:hypothetical protein [Mycobacteriales bacterium]
MIDVLEPIQSREPAADWRRPWARWLGMTVLTAIVITALCNVYGQRASTQQVSGPLAQLTLRAPTTVRPGLLFQAKITITADQTLPNAELVLSHGWVDGLTMNTEEPSPTNETSGPDGSLIFGIGTLQPGQPFVQYLDYQVNPTSLSRRPQTLVVRSNGTVAASLDRTLTIVP